MEIINKDDILFGLLRLRISDIKLDSQAHDINTENKEFSVSQPRKPSVFGAQKSNGFSLTLGTQKVRDVDKNLTYENNRIYVNNLRKSRASDSERFSEGEIRIINNQARSRAERVKHAMIRELHVYGQALKLGEKGNVGQHTGLGKWLMSEAEKIAKEEKCKKISIISGVGVRNYYRKLGYELEKEGEYMGKEI